ncbi:hypothetical protein ABN034_19325 [Actinopolymorpha sp. B11F2]|uniref:hypothetical protein n=1 Tax=Actinopolymorpha sp. B11F2 TaxID=3160862 RepID=UPI0032E52AB6
MAVGRVKVEYLDGRVEIGAVTARVQVAVERKYEIGLSEVKTNEQIFYAAHAALTQAGKESADFEGFLDKVADVEFVPAKAVDLQAEDPTLTAGSGS